MTKPRIIFFAGKGGVGKTTHAATTAVCCAQDGYATLLISTDPAHSLSDLFQQSPAGALQTVTKNLDLMEVDPYRELQSNWGNIRDYLSSLLMTLGAEETVAAELAIIPGMDNLFSLLRIGEYCESGKYQVIIVDMAPTADSLRLLSLPQLISSALNITRYLEKYLISPVVRPASKMSKSLQRVVAPADVARSWESILEKILAVKDLLDHRTDSSVRLVMTPEQLVIAESQRLLTYLSLFGLTTELVVINRLFPASENEHLNTWHKQQQKHVKHIEHTFSPLPVLRSEYASFEVVGLQRLLQFGKRIYADTDPSRKFYLQKPVKILTEGPSRVFSMAMPFIDPARCSLLAKSNELLISYGTQIRSYVLPDSFAGLEPMEASYKDGYLAVTFRRRNA